MGTTTGTTMGMTDEAYQCIHRVLGHLVLNDQYADSPIVRDMKALYHEVGRLRAEIVEAISILNVVPLTPISGIQLGAAAARAMDCLTVSDKTRKDALALIPNISVLIDERDALLARVAELDEMPCGHPKVCLVFADNGPGEPDGSFCGWCSETWLTDAQRKRAVRQQVVASFAKDDKP